MKNTIRILLIVIIVLFASCGHPISGPQQRLEELKQHYDEVGFCHNQELDVLKHEFHKCDDITLESAKALIETHYQQLDPVFSNSVAEGLFNYIANASILGKSTVNAELIDLLADSLELYARYPEVFDSMSYVLDMNISVREKCHNLEKIYLFADQKAVDDEDKDALMNGLSTTIHSLEYWENNYHDWHETLTGNMAKPSLGIVGAIGIIDGAGAVVGTIEGFRDIPKGTEKRGRKIVGRAVGEGVKTSAFAVLSLVLL